MEDVVIVSAARTPVGSFSGAFAAVPAHKLGEVAIRAALERHVDRAYYLQLHTPKPAAEKSEERKMGFGRHEYDVFKRIGEKEPAFSRIREITV